jgi:hypothetical protein
MPLILLLSNLYSYVVMLYSGYTYTRDYSITVSDHGENHSLGQHTQRIYKRNFQLPTTENRNELCVDKAYVWKHIDWHCLKTEKLFHEFCCFRYFCFVLVTVVSATNSGYIPGITFRISTQSSFLFSVVGNFSVLRQCQSICFQTYAFLIEIVQ